jgi:peptidoglycan/xylan/chitin deacetylase (PgdA/CDA1 family)
LALLFTGHTFAEGGETILSALSRHKAKASFFLAGDFLNNTNFAPLVRRMLSDGHYLGPHSDKHLPFCSWEQRPRTLVTRPEFNQDLEANLQKLVRAGVPRQALRYFVPACEHSNQQIAGWAKELRLTLINFTPGTCSNADYTGEADSNFVPSQTVLDSIMTREQRDPHGLNGFLLLLHLGSGPNRAEKFHNRFGELLDYLGAKGYQCVRVDELLERNEAR